MTVHPQRCSSLSGAACPGVQSSRPCTAQSCPSLAAHGSCEVLSTCRASWCVICIKASPPTSLPPIPDRVHRLRAMHCLISFSTSAARSCHHVTTSQFLPSVQRRCPADVTVPFANVHGSNHTAWCNARIARMQAASRSSNACCLSLERLRSPPSAHQQALPPLQKALVICRKGASSNACSNRLEELQIVVGVVYLEQHLWHTAATAHDRGGPRA